jgi:DNA modification methylase
VILRGDCVERMRELDEASVDAVVCDPPYGLEFMGKEWDSFAKGRSAKYAKGGDLTHTEFKNLGTLPQYVSRPAKRCGKCGKQAWSGSPCQCGEPRWELDNSPLHAAQEWHQAWATEALRVLKPGGHLLAFGGTRTYHRLACAIEDAGFEIRDSLIWIYGSGFPKSLDVSKAIDKANGEVRDLPRHSDWTCTPGTSTNICDRCGRSKGGQPGNCQCDKNGNPITPEAQQWQGWGTALKPAHEPIVVARKPLSGTVAANVLEYGTGALNVDGCRVEASADDQEAQLRANTAGAGRYQETRNGRTFENPPAQADHDPSKGRWPANLALSHLPECERVGVRRVKAGEAVNRNRGERIPSTVNYADHDGKDATYADPDGTETIPSYECAPGCPVAELDRQSGELKSHGAAKWGTEAGNERRVAYGDYGETRGEFFNDTGGASRFFYVAKSSRAERNAGLDGFEEVVGKRTQDGGDDTRGRPLPINRNHHPTVKPIDLMRWLVRLVTPPGGLCVDPFAGSGTTGIACHLEGFDFIGIEREDEYADIAKARIEWWSQFPAGTTTEAALGVEAVERKVKESGQGSLLEDAA